MSSRSYTRRNRPVTACRECHRRKQKCDRMKPCNVCLGRNVPEKCLYGDDVLKLMNASKQREQAGPLTPPSDDESETEEDPAPPANTLEQQIGYSALSDNAFIDLYKSIDAVHIPTPGSLALSRTPLRPQLKEKYFRLVALLPSRSICNSLIETYFCEANWYFATLDRYYLDRLHAAWLASALPDESSIKLEQYPRDLQHFPALLLQILAVGLHFSSAHSDVLKSLKLANSAACEKQSQTYSDTGCEIMAILGPQNASITGIEHDLMRLTWLKNVSRGAESWHCIGSAIRQAHDLELHLDSGQDDRSDSIKLTSEQIWYEEYKRRVWCRLFFTDSHMCLVLGRPRHIHLDDCSTEWPIDCDIPDNISNTIPTAPRPTDVPSSFTFVIFLAQLGMKIHEMLSAESKKAFRQDYRKVEKLHQDVEAILESLPAVLRPQNPDTSWDMLKPHFPKLRQQILSSANSFLMKLHKPYIHSNENSRTTVVRAALGTLDAQQGLFELMLASSNQLRIYGFSFYTIDASILLSATVINNFPQNPDMVNHINRSLRQAIDRLARLKNNSAVSASGEKLLIKCYAKINSIHPVLSNTTSEMGMFKFLPEPMLDGSDSRFLDGFTLPEPQDFDLGSISNLFDSADYMMDDNIDLFSLSPSSNSQGSGMSPAIF